MNNLSSIVQQLDALPATITKDQFYRICHISKRHAKYLLDSGLVKCMDSGKKTRRYTIQAKDVWAYLIDHDAHPEKYRAPAGYYSAHPGKPKQHPDSIQLSESKELIPFTNHEKTLLYTLWEREAADYADLMTTTDVCNLTGYQSKTIYNWYHYHLVIGFMIRHRLLIPKLSLLEYLSGDTANAIVRKSAKHRTLLCQYSQTVTGDGSVKDFSQNGLQTLV